MVSAELATTIVNTALDQFFERDQDLAADVNERCLAHRIAVYIEEQLRDREIALSVDCEYNLMNGVDPKLLNGLVGRPQLNGRLRTGRVVPDIIVHRRGPAGPNVIAIEIKWSWEDERDDREKLRLYKAELGYTHAFFVQVANTRAGCEMHPL